MSIRDKIVQKQTPMIMAIEVVVIVLVLAIFSFSSCSQYQDMEREAIKNMTLENNMVE